MIRPIWRLFIAVRLPAHVRKLLTGDPVSNNNALLGYPFFPIYFVTFNSEAAAASWAQRNYPGMRCQARCTLRGRTNPKPVWYVWSELHDAILVARYPGNMPASFDRGETEFTKVSMVHEIAL